MLGSVSKTCSFIFCRNCYRLESSLLRKLLKMPKLKKKKSSHLRLSIENQRKKQGVDVCRKSFHLTGNELLATLQKVHWCCQTSPDCLRLVELEEERSGHMRALKVICRDCNLDTYVDSNPERKATTFRESVTTNRKFAFAADCAGMDFEQLKTFCAILNIPGPPDSYDSVHQEVIYNNVMGHLNQILEQNRAHSLQNCQRKSADGKGIIAVKTDGTYQKRGDVRRGYTSKIAVVLLTDAYTGRFLDFRVLTKYCHICTQQRKLLNPIQFIDWKKVHQEKGECSSNFEGPSTEMERVAVKDMFQKSLESNLMYLYLVGDGDSKSFKDIWDIYGACNHCRDKSDILVKRASREYEEWAKTEDYQNWVEAHSEVDGQCYAVRKLDCVQHVGKCLGSRLEKVSKSSKTAADGKSMTNGKHRLGKSARIHLRAYFTKALKQFARPGMLSVAEQDEGTAALKRGILASLYHNLILEDEDRRHQYCPMESWCSYKCGKQFVNKPHHINQIFEQLLLPVYEYYTQRAMLNKLLAGMTTNDLECFNSTLWTIIPKSKFHGKKRVEIAVMVSIIRYEQGQVGLLPVMNRLGIDTDEASLVFPKHDQVRKSLGEKQRHSRHTSFERRRSSALQLMNSLPSSSSSSPVTFSTSAPSTSTSFPSYGPGIYDSGSGPSADMLAVPGVLDRNICQVDIGKFVVVPCGPVWYATKVVDISTETNEVQVKYMYCKKDKISYYWAETELFWEYRSKLLMSLSEPVKADRSTSTRTFFNFPPNEIERANAAFAELRKMKRQPRK